MTKQVQRRRGTASQHTSFTGADGELSVNTTNKSVHVHDGVTTGGIEAARADLTNVSDASLNTALAGNTLSSLTITSADINGGTIDGTTIGSASPAAITGTALTATTSATLQHSASTKLATTATGIDVTGTVTADGLTVDGTNAKVNLGTFVGVQAVNNTPALTDNAYFDGSWKYKNTGAAGVIDAYRDSFSLRVRSASSGSADAAVTWASRLLVGNNGDISFYEDTGTTPKFFWDASAEALGIGTTAPSYAISLVKNTTGAHGIDVLNSTTGTGSSRLILRNTSDTNGSGFQIINNAQDGAVNLLNYKDTSLAFWTSSALRMTITSTGSVGIGTSSPATKFEVTPSTSEFDGIKVSRGPTFESSQYSIINQHTGALKLTSVVTGGGNSGGIIFSRSNNGTSSSESMRIDSAGNLIVGKPAANNTTVGSVFYPSGAASHVASGGITTLFNRLTSDGDITVFQKDGVRAGSIGYISSGLYIDGETGHAGLRFGGADITPRDGGVDADAAIQLGQSGARFTDLYLSGGVYLGGTGAANKLDDYEEGTWTPTIRAYGSDPSVTYNTGNTGGIYTKVGDIVWISFEVRWSAITGGSGDVYISGLPFTRNSTFLPDGDRGTFDYYNMTVPSGGLTAIASVGRANSIVGLGFTRSGASAVDIPVGNLINTDPGFIRASLTYKV